MKAKVPNDFFRFIRQFTLESMIKSVSFWSFDIYRKKDQEMGSFSGHRVYDSITFPITLVQTWLIDLIYELINYNHYGHMVISTHEALKLIGLYNDYLNNKEKAYVKKSDTWLYLYGFFGEQCRFQNSSFFEEFAREKYILEKISKYPNDTSYNIDFETEFLKETSFSTDVYSANLYVIFALFFFKSNVVNKEDVIRYFANSPINYEDILRIIDSNSISIEKINHHPLGRQVFYTKPIIKINEQYVATNPFLLLALFSNSNYWIIRNKYNTIGSQNFINAFGIYFEKYVEELLCRCLIENEYIKIPVNNTEKRADWKLNIEGFNILVEQKSTIPVLGIKQNQPDITAIKKHILKAWGEAVEQLSETEKFYSISNCIKIILVYDEYFKAECLEELFKLRSDLINDGNYWLLNIRDFEMLMMLYCKDKNVFKAVMNEKIQSETTFSHNGRDLSLFLNKYNINHNDYMTEYGIYNETERIIKYYIHNEGD